MRWRWRQRSSGRSSNEEGRAWLVDGPCLGVVFVIFCVRRWRSGATRKRGTTSRIALKCRPPASWPPCRRGHFQDEPA
eukprot:666445-Pyramimonas_sp.AAC.1